MGQEVGAMRKRHATEIVGTQLRLREGLRQRVLRESEKSGRSLNAELVYRIEQSFEYDKEKEDFRKREEDLRKREEKVLERLDKADERTDAADQVYRRVVHVLEAVNLIGSSPRSSPVRLSTNEEKGEK
jgi:hypothetical protein